MKYTIYARDRNIRSVQKFLLIFATFFITIKKLIQYKLIEVFSMIFFHFSAIHPLSYFTRARARVCVCVCVRVCREGWKHNENKIILFNTPIINESCKL